MTVQPDGSVRHEVVVDLRVEDAFEMFTDSDRIKAHEHNMLAVPIEQTVLERHVGGDVYDKGVDGSICRWALVLTFDPPTVITFSWDIGPDWQITTDLDRTSEVEITFTPQGSRQTRVTLVHRNIDRHGTGWESLRDGLEAPDGWPLYLAGTTPSAGTKTSTPIRSLSSWPATSGHVASHPLSREASH